MKSIIITKGITRFSREIPQFARDIFEQNPQVRGIIYKKEEYVSISRSMTRELLLAIAFYLNHYSEINVSKTGKVKVHLENH